MLPVLDVLYFHASAHARPALVDVRAPGGFGNRHVYGSPPRSSYRLLQRVAPESLQQWARGQARFDLSRSGALRVWMAGHIVAAESGDDCRVHGAQALTSGECDYLDAYMAFIGRRWSDPDQRLAPGES